MDKDEYLRLLVDVLINNVIKFRMVDLERLKSRGRFSKYYYFFL